jgi:hypothetical protein
MAQIICTTDFLMLNGQYLVLPVLLVNTCTQNLTYSWVIVIKTEKKNHRKNKEYYEPYPDGFGS